jgi:hypothetical protein
MSHFIKSEVARLVLSYLHEFKLGRKLENPDQLVYGNARLVIFLDKAN